MTLTKKQTETEINKKQTQSRKTTQIQEKRKIKGSATEIGKEAPSTIPKLSHLVQLLHTHNSAVRILLLLLLLFLR